MKKLAHAVAGKSAHMMKPADAERFTGYHVGGISPFGTRKALPVHVARDLLGFDAILINGGQRGLLIEIDPRLLVELLAADPVDCALPDG